MNHIRLTLTALVVVLALLCSGCGATLSPRTSATLAWTEWAESGAMVDASRAHPVAFWANPSRSPTVVDVGGAEFAAGQWLTHLALRMNQAIRSKTLFDSRFAAVGPKLFAWELAAGRYTYTYHDTAAKTAALVARSRARAVELRLISAKRLQLGADTGVRLLVAATGGGRTRNYTAETTQSHAWDVTCMDQIARKILGDPNFWAAAKSIK